MNFTFAIPPNDGNHQVGPYSTVARHDTDIIALMPHMHMRGKAARFEAFYPNGTTEVLLDVPQFDFSWQTVYYYRRVEAHPKGTRVEYTAWYDTPPRRGPATVSLGPHRALRPALDDEMMMGGFMMSAAAPEE